MKELIKETIKRATTDEVVDLILELHAEIAVLKDQLESIEKILNENV